MRIPPSWTVSAGLALLLLVLAAGSPPAAAAPDAPSVSVRTLGLAQVDGTLVGLDGAALTVRADGAERRFPLEEVISLELPGPAATPPTTRRLRIGLAGGEVLVARFAGAKDDVLTLESRALGRLDVLLDTVRSVETLPVEADPCDDAASTHPRPEKEDAAYDLRGDEYRGAVLEATNTHVVIENERGRERKLTWERLRVMHLQTAALEPATGLRAEVELRDGSRLPVAGPLRYEGGTFHFALRALPKTTLSAKAGAVRAVRWTDGRFVYASDLPITSELRPYYADPEGLFDPTYRERWWGTRVDRRASGCPLRVDGKTYRHGFGVNSHNVITIQLAGAYARFRAGFGIDDEVFDEVGSGGKRGDVDARVLADGKVLWEAKGVKGGEKARRVGPLDVRGVKTLVLEVGFGKELMALDRADWCDPILVKK